MKKTLILMCLFLTSCKISDVTIPIIIGKTMWDDKTAVKYYNDKPLFLFKNIKIALKDLEISTNLVSENKILTDKFKIYIRQVKSNITEVKICINSIEEKSQVNLIFNQIDLSTNTINFDDQGKPAKHKQRKLVNQ